MKITKATLEKLIKEELSSFMSEEDIDMELDTDADAEESTDEVMDKLKSVYDILQGIFADEEEGEEGLEDLGDEELDESEDLDESDDLDEKKEEMDEKKEEMDESEDLDEKKYKDQLDESVMRKFQKIAFNKGKTLLK